MNKKNDLSVSVNAFDLSVSVAEQFKAISDFLLKENNVIPVAELTLISINLCKAKQIAEQIQCIIDECNRLNTGGFNSSEFKESLNESMLRMSYESIIRASSNSSETARKNALRKLQKTLSEMPSKLPGSNEFIMKENLTKDEIKRILSDDVNSNQDSHYEWDHQRFRYTFSPEFSLACFRNRDKTKEGRLSSDNLPSELDYLMVMVGKDAIENALIDIANECGFGSVMEYHEAVLSGFDPSRQLRAVKTLTKEEEQIDLDFVDGDPFLWSVNKEGYIKVGSSLAVYISRFRKDLSLTKIKYGYLATGKNKKLIGELCNVATINENGAVVNLITECTKDIVKHFGIKSLDLYLSQVKNGNDPLADFRESSKV